MVLTQTKTRRDCGMETKKYVRIIRNFSKYGDMTGQIFPLLGTWEDSYKIDGSDGVVYVRKKDVEVIVTEKRPAEAGERVLITYAAPIEEQAYEKGDVFVAESTNDPVHKCVRVLGMPEYIDYTEYEVIVENEVKYEEADEMKNGKTRYDLAVENAREAIEELRLVAYEQGYEDARRQLNAKAPTVNAQARRDEIVEQAKADAEELANKYGYYYAYGRNTKAEFIVNCEKRTVVTILRWIADGQIVAKGIAKAAPADCFNVHIGKVIALRRALGLAVPDEYLNVPQPTEVRVGDVVEGWAVKDTALVISDDAWPPISGAWIPLKYARQYELRIIDDSREEVDK
ncbi:hypothetical protein [Bacillus subtilis]|uniref:hypothetical protein n=1 Tax=Bacillus subtilis TaxID=1423 RepID=UPI0024BF4D22|nr:hypothetical protein [Bacillus subtilis]MDK1004070.1 hypothetical protein [Bacillus subtilis]